MSSKPVGRSVDRFLEVVAVVLLGIATVGTAWCGLQSALWSGEADRIANVAAEERADANRLFGLATQAIAYDATTVANYAQAVVADDARLQKFYRTLLVRKAFVSYLDSWEAEIKAGGIPKNLTEDEHYLAEVFGPYRATQSQADLDAKAAEIAGRTGDLYVLATVLLAVSMFFAGVTASFRSPTLRMVLMAACLATILISAERLADLPIAPATWTLALTG